MPFLIWTPFLYLYLASLLLLPVVITMKKRPANAVAWLLTIIFLPVFGAILFLIFGTNRVVSKAQKKLLTNTFLKNRLAEIGLPLDDYDEADLAPSGDWLHNIAAISRRLSSFDCVGSNHATILVDAEQTYASIEKAIQQAREYVCLEYYLFDPDETGKRFRDLLIQKASEGVRIYFLYDAVGSRKLGWNHSFLKPMIEAGIQPREFLPLRTFIRPWNMNLRNHRKIAIIDAHTAFAGSLNIGDKFLSQRGRGKRSCRETHLKIQGPVTGQLQWIFCEDWYFATGEELISSVYLDKSASAGEDIIQIVASGPDAREEAIHKTIISAINHSKKRVFLTSPYFIPDRALELTLQMAALRGVEVRLLVPARSDHPFVHLAGRSYYENLMQYGVKINTYLPGFLHAKMLVVDGLFTVIGSANIDVRSFSYNFEINVQLYGERVARIAEAVFSDDLLKSSELDLTEYRNRPPHVRFAENFCRLFSPQL